MLAHTDEQMKLPVRARKTAVPEEEELELPEAEVGDREGVGLGPVPAVCEGDVERGLGCAVGLDGLVESRRRVVEGSQADEVDADRVVYLRGLVVRDAEDDRSGLGDIEDRRIAGGVATGPEDVELGERLARTR